MDEKQLQALANELAKNLKTPEDLSQFDRLLKKLSVEAALNAEMTHHLGYEKNQSRPGANSRNGYSTKTVITGDGPLELRTPRDRDGTFEPQLVKKNQTRITGMDNQILSLYAKGMTTREIATAFKELYDADVSPTLISKVTDAVMEQVVEWQNRPLDAVYPIVYLDCIVLKVRQDSRVINKSVFLALGINIEGQKELPGMWLAENEGAKFWLLYYSMALLCRLLCLNFRSTVNIVPAKNGLLGDCEVTGYIIWVPTSWGFSQSALSLT